MTKPDPTRQTYDLHARQIADRFWAGNLLHLLTPFLGLLSPGARILDLGCGAGRDTGHISKQGYPVVGVDLSFGMLLEASRRAPGTYIHGDMTVLPFAPASFDAVWASASLLHLPRGLAPGVLANVHNLLKPGGILYLSLKTGEGERWEEREGKRFFTFYQPDEVLRLLTEAEYEIIQNRTEPAKSFNWLNILAKRS